ncbi:hypothetical protein SAMN05660865_01490 [Caloramator fervidus]|uniref:FlaG protein n=1 Tax=Caloramator fervidus TaxID=29344 RepID=A0A1H5WJM6_9CLOT|nr:hypothetical protein [Caloramator fervidus]SEF99481.1 hypothetical protein SAMN05660865_01490 [Caloramator fervidus]
MGINPITLDKIDPLVIKQIETKIVDKIVHEVKSGELKRDNKKGFDEEKQRRACEGFAAVLQKYKIKLEYKLEKNKVKIKLKDKDGKIIIEAEVDDVEDLLESFNKITGKIIDLRG